MHTGGFDGFDDVPAILLDCGRLAEHSAGAGRAERYNEVRFHHPQFALQPLVAGGDLHFVRLLVDTTFAARLELEMFDCVRDVSQLSIDIGVLEGAIEHAARGTDEGLAREILLVAGLLADEHDLRALQASTEHRLRGIAPQRAVAALLYRGA